MSLMDRIERQRRRLAAARRQEHTVCTPEEHAAAFSELLELTDSLLDGARGPAEPEARTPEAVELWRRLVARGRA